MHFSKNARTQTIKTFVKERLTPNLQLFLRGKDLFQEDLLEQATTTYLNAMETLERMHDMPVHEATLRGELYHMNFLSSETWRSLKAAMDLWCACWFWPVDKIEHAPLPTGFAHPPDATRAIAEQVAAQERFFHWELEFPDVFRERAAPLSGNEPTDKATTASAEKKITGFDALLGNPPWDVAKPLSKEFFSNIDPPVPHLWQTGSSTSATELLPGTCRYRERVAGLQLPFSCAIQLHQLRRQPFRRPGYE